MVSSAIWVSPTPEELQRRLKHALEDLKGVLPIQYDILIYGAGTTEEEQLLSVIY